MKSKIKIQSASFEVNGIPVVMTGLNESLTSRAKYLVNTSVQDMQSGLWNYTSRDDLQVLRVALMIVNRRGEKTKVRILKSKIKKLEKELSHG